MRSTNVCVSYSINLHKPLSYKPRRFRLKSLILSLMAARNANASSSSQKFNPARQSCRNRKQNLQSESSGGLEIGKTSS